VKPGVMFHAPRNVGECDGMNPTLPNELPLWELESRWISKFSKSDYRGRIIYINSVSFSVCDGGFGGWGKGEAGEATGDFFS
jgi:hypothetical protein